MQRTATIRFLTPSTNKKGDLFTRLMKDFFRAMGYDDIRLDVQKSGREIDIEGRHRHAPRLLRAECKAHEVKMGGTELNTFFGAVARERKKADKVIDAYFVSLNGFTQTSRIQEQETGDDQLILLDGPKIIAELEQHKLLLDDAAATEQAGRCAGRAGLMAGMLNGIELLAYEKGYVKAVYYAQHGQCTHFALIHADGTPLAAAPAKEVIEADRSVGGTLHTLQYLPPAPVVADQQAMQAVALDHYQRWLKAECSFIQLDGLPADNDASSTKLKLERLFIPLKAENLHQEGPDVVNPNPVISFDDFEYDPDDEDARESISDFIIYSRNPEPISELLAPGRKLAFLAPPGGGKSTLLKRLATEYGFADKTAKFADEMPAHDWLPLLIRCRDLQDRAKKPFMKLLKHLPKQLNMLPEPATAFKAYLHEALQLGRVLLLIDGLDEIAKEQNRKVFAQNLLSFLTMFPQVTLVLTSREAGFRLVADVIAGKCEQYKLASFTEQDVKRLCEQWHVEVVNDSLEVRQKAQKLAKGIWDNKHIRQLARNPLLLTTLFVVNRRQGGELPKNRTMLYSKAVEVLVQTWNTEAFEPLDVEETLVMLCYLACHMMEKNIQRISQRELIQTLKQAQQKVPELRFMQTSPANFIKLVEYRSSLLMQIGSELIDGEEQHLFEFRHLTFQEYLAAKGYVEGYHPRNDEEIPLVKLLTPHLGQTSWREVIPIAAALAKRNAEGIIETLVERCSGMKSAKNKPHSRHRATIDILRRCILDEVLISSPELLNKALTHLGRLIPDAQAPEFARDITEGKFGKLYRRTIEQAYLANAEGWREYTTAFNELSILRLEQKTTGHDSLLVDKAISLLREESELSRLQALVAVGSLGFREYTGFHRIVDERPHFRTTEAQARELYALFDRQLLSQNTRMLLAAGWAFAWLPSIVPDGVLPLASSIASLFRIVGEVEVGRFVKEEGKSLQRYVATTLKNLPVLGRKALVGEDVGKYYVDEEGVGRFPLELNFWFTTNHAYELSLLAAWYHMVTMTDEEMLKHIDDVYDVSSRFQPGHDQEHPNVSRMLELLGPAGQRLLGKRAKQRQRTN